MEWGKARQSRAGQGEVGGFLFNILQGWDRMADRRADRKADQPACERDDAGWLVVMERASSTVMFALDPRTVRGVLSAPIYQYLRCQKKPTGVSKSSTQGSRGGPWLDSFCGGQPMLRAYPQNHPRSHHICNSRVSRPLYMATRQPGITPILRQFLFPYYSHLGP